MPFVFHTLAWLLMAGMAQAQAVVCHPHDKVVAWLTGEYGEVLVAISEGAQGTFVEMFENAETGTWTVLQSNADGVACVAAAGQDWQDVPQGDPA
jgi:hypothetical protein